MATQEIIIYRNPVEQSFWALTTDHPEYFITFLAAFVFFIVWIKLVEKLCVWYGYRRMNMGWKTIQKIQMYSGIIATGIFAYFFFNWL